MAAKTVRNGPGLAEVLKRVRDSAVSVGIHADAGVHDNADGATVAQIGAYNEFGTETIPERSFLRSTMADKRAEYTRNINKIVKSALSGKRDARQGMGLLGRQAENDIKLTIRNLMTPPNAESTIRAKKGANNPLIDTGQMLNSIRWQYIEGT